MKNYIGTKMIQARPMTRGEYNNYRSIPPQATDNGEDQGYLVEYLDGGIPNHPDHTGYISWSPAAQFENAYRETSGLTFGHALEALKRGDKVQRKRWEIFGQMFVYMVPAGRYPAKAKAAKNYWGDDSHVPYEAYFAIVSSKETVSTWVPTIGDTLAEDWSIVY